MAKIMINVASLELLMTVPGIGAANARKIIQAREEADCQLTLDQYLQLAPGKAYPMSVENFDFAPYMASERVHTELRDDARSQGSGVVAEFGEEDDIDEEEGHDTAAAEGFGLTYDHALRPPFSGPSLVGLDMGGALATGRSDPVTLPIEALAGMPSEDIKSVMDFVQQLRQEREGLKSELEAINTQRQAEKKAMEDMEAHFQKEMTSLRGLFDTQRQEEKSRFEALKKKADKDRQVLEREVSKLRAKATPPSPMSKITATAVEFDDLIRQAEGCRDKGRVAFLSREKKRVIKQLEAELQRGSATSMPTPRNIAPTPRNIAPSVPKKVPTLKKKSVADSLKFPELDLTPGSGTPVSEGDGPLNSSVLEMADNVSTMAPHGIYRQQPATVMHPMRDMGPAGVYTPGRGVLGGFGSRNDTFGGISGSSRTSDLTRSLPKIQKYDGTENWKAFFSQFKIYSRLHGWTEEDKLAHLSVCLRGKAAEFLSYQPQAVQDSYSRLVEKLEKRFGMKDLPETLRTEFRSSSMKQKPEESLEEWAERVQKMALEAFVDLPEHYMNREIVNKFCQCLADKDAAQVVSDKNPETIEDALQHVKRHVLNSKAIFGNRKQVRQLEMEHAHNYSNLNVRSIQEPEYWRSDCSSGYTNYDNTTNSQPVCQDSSTSDLHYPSDISDMTVRRLNRPQSSGRSNMSSNNSNNNNISSLDARLKHLEDFCSSSFNKLFKMLEMNKPTGSPVRPRFSSPTRSGKCFTCHQPGHYSPECPMKDQRSRSPSPSRGQDEQKKVSFALNKEKSGV